MRETGNGGDGEGESRESGEGGTEGRGEGEEDTLASRVDLYWDGHGRRKCAGVRPCLSRSEQVGIKRRGRWEGKSSYAEVGEWQAQPQRHVCVGKQRRVLSLRERRLFWAVVPAHIWKEYGRRGDLSTDTEQGGGRESHMWELRFGVAGIGGAGSGRAGVAAYLPSSELLTTPASASSLPLLTPSE
ncbi:hypothetical protein DFH08DRAFT_820256 [Mycena albidolilacea]|uniref:Uncharacterized protein n=1 Tax=Mycena albidolilacea TaxID=1033008 RepID=A0AAD7EFJ7_9AGAR|nr:hypothetical protein DFH08DRAFT_820256 [Mycena albidolilacea]